MNVSGKLGKKLVVLLFVLVFTGGVFDAIKSNEEFFPRWMVGISIAVGGGVLPLTALLVRWQTGTVEEAKPPRKSRRPAKTETKQEEDTKPGDLA